MQKSYNYFETSTFLGQLDVEDIGDCAIEANNDKGLVYYLIIKTIYGITHCLETGPFIIDLEELPKVSNIRYFSFEFNDKKINKIIDSFLNDPNREITQAKIVDEEEVYENSRDILQYFKDLKQKE